MINTANLFIQSYIEKTSSLRHFAYNGEFPEAAAILKDFEKEFRGHFSEALKVREEYILSMREAIQRERETSPENHSEFYDMLMSNIISTIPLSFTDKEESDLPF
nr:MAG TPA: hypothetical protein [Bacteriophage sp.]